MYIIYIYIYIYIQIIFFCIPALLPPPPPPLPPAGLLLHPKGGERPKLVGQVDGVRVAGAGAGDQVAGEGERLGDEQHGLAGDAEPALEGDPLGLACKGCHGRWPRLLQLTGP